MHDGAATASCHAREQARRPAWRPAALHKHARCRTFSELGLQYNIDGLTGNTANSHRLIAWAGATGGAATQNALVQELFSNYFCEVRGQRTARCLCAGSITPGPATRRHHARLLACAPLAVRRSSSTITRCWWRQRPRWARPRLLWAVRRVRASTRTRVCVRWAAKGAVGAGCLVHQQAAARL